MISRQILSDVSSHLIKLPDDISKAVSHYTLDKVQPRVISFEEQVASIRQHLADIYERNQNWRDAASVLVGIPLETGQKYTLLTIVISKYRERILFQTIRDRLQTRNVPENSPSVPRRRRSGAGRSVH